MTVPPHDPQIELLLIASTFYDPHCVDELPGLVRPDQLFLTHNRILLEVIYAMRDAGATVFDAITVRKELERRGQFEDVGEQYLQKVATEGYSAPNFDGYAREAVLLHKRRLLLQVGQDAIRRAEEGHGDVDESLREIEAAFSSISSGDHNLAESHVDRILDRAMVKIADRMGTGGGGVPSGFVNLDRITSGFHENEVTIVAAAAGTGKTALVCNIAVAVAQRAADLAPADQKIPRGGVAIFSYEQGDTQLAERMLSIGSKVSCHRLRQGTIDEIDQFALTEAANDLRRLPIFIIDSAGMTATTMAARARALHARFEIGMMMVDYLQIVAPDAGVSQREQQVATISRRLKLTAKQLHIPVVALSQINKDAEKRGDARPRLSDLRESGAIAADADVVMFLQRGDQTANEGDTSRDNEADLIVAKNRSGPTGTAELVWMKESLRFGDRSIITQPEWVP